jgi:hypothetical protein
MSGPPHAVIVSVDESALEDLRNYAYGSAHRGGGSTEHWDEPRGAETPFCFMTWDAAFLFILHCQAQGVTLRVKHQG